MKVKDYKDLLVWKKGIEIVDSVYENTRSFPSYEKYGLATQMQRAAISVPSNIAEGFDRQYTKEYKQFLYISLSSCSELETQTIIANKRNYLSQNSFEYLIDQIIIEKKLLRALIKALEPV